MESAKERAHRSNERAMEILVRALQESFGFGDVGVDFVEFLASIAEPCGLLDGSEFVGFHRNPAVGVPSVFRPRVGPAETPGSVPNARLCGPHRGRRDPLA